LSTTNATRPMKGSKEMEGYRLSFSEEKTKKLPLTL